MTKPIKPHSKTGLQTVALCPRKYKYIYEDRRESNEPKNFILRFGNVWHSAMERGYWPNLHLPYDEHVTKCIEAAQSADDVGDCAGLLMGVLLACYVDRWAEWAKGYELMSTEEDLETTYSGVPFRYILDTRIREKSTGKVYAMEHKTTRQDIRLDSPYWDLDFDLQVGFYDHLDDADGILYDVVKVPPLRPGKLGRRIIDETDDEFIERASTEIQKNYDKWFAREPVKSDEHVMTDALSLVACIEFYRAHRHWPRSKNACGSWGRRCEYYPVCSGDASIDDDTLYQERRRR